MIEPWHSHSWKKFQAKQQPFYSEQSKLNRVLDKIQKSPNIVSISEIKNLRSLLSLASMGHYFLLQAGDCAERFIDSSKKTVTTKVLAIQEMKQLLEDSLKKPIITIGRIAGQYAKPRSSIFEETSKGKIHNFRGDNINSFSIKERKVIPERLEQGYHLAKQSYNFIQEYTKESSKSFFISHEALHLPLESALTRQDRTDGLFYNVGAHTLWVGERTRFPGSAHIEYIRGLENPIGLKISHDTAPSEIPLLLKSLNPNNIKGKVTLITRLGAKNVSKFLAPFIEIVKEQQLNVLWMCDPMHGNSFMTHTGLKTRDFQTILEELEQTLAIHKEQESILAGIHLESAGTNVTECLGGLVNPISCENLKDNYETQCDPRLNYKQSLELIHHFCKIQTIDSNSLGSKNNKKALQTSNLLQIPPLKSSHIRSFSSLKNQNLADL